MLAVGVGTGAGLLGLAVEVLDVGCAGPAAVGAVVDALDEQALSAITTATGTARAIRRVVRERELTAGHDPSRAARW